jgi:hypothetical protein
MWVLAKHGEAWRIMANHGESWRIMANHERSVRSPSGGAIMFTFESFTTLMVGAMAIPTLALLVIGLSTPQVAPDHMRH